MIAQPSGRPTQSAVRNLTGPPVSAGEFAAAMSPLVGEARFAVAVSGGADSTALMLLASDWCSHVNRPKPLVVTVDHGLRENSSAEAETVASWAIARGMSHTTLKWAGQKKPGNIQSQARQARYELVGHWMKAHGVSSLLTGHTLDDHAETFLIRLARGSGLDGLSGMSVKSPFPTALHRDLTLLRPLLEFTHERLKATLRANGQTWIEDPTNENPRFLRTQLRVLAPSLDAVGITPARLAATMKHLRRSNEAILGQVRELIGRAAPIERWGYSLLDAQAFQAAPYDVALRALARLLQAIGGQTYPPEFEQTESTLSWICDGKDPATGRTLSGCRLVRKPGERILIAREEADALTSPALELNPGSSTVWDRRFEVTIPANAPPGAYIVRTLEDEALRVLEKNGDFPSLEPNRIARTLPAIWYEGAFHSAPMLKAPRNFLGTARFLAPLDHEVGRK